MRSIEARAGVRPLPAAIAFHALAIAALLLAPVRRTTPQALLPAGEPEAAIEVTNEELPAADEGVAPAAPSALGEPAAVALATAPTTMNAPHAAEATPTEAPAPAPIAPGSPVALVMPTASPAIGLALGGPNAFAGGPEGERAGGLARPASEDRPRTAAEAKRAVETALREPARQRERELGLGPEGPVLKALVDATSESTAPVKGRAVFRAVANGAGMIVGIEVLECDGGRTGWANAAELARRALTGTKLRMPSTATRAEMRIEIVSDWQLPSGHHPGTDVSVLGLPVAKGEGKKSTKVDLLNPLPKIEMVEIAPDVKIPVPQINVTIVAVHGDPADIGAKPRRIVHTKLLDSKIL